MADDGWQRIKAHIKQYREDPEAAHEWNPYGKVVTALLLTTTGRKTGKQFSRPLIYKKVGESYVIVASMGGAPTNPNWYRNVVAQPECEIQVAQEVVPVRARTAEGEERERLWNEMVEVLPQYAEYQSRTDRLIPVVVLEPRG
jgi:deazaflavin-dependent oxidoreductase (nitroreductase family)